MIVGRYLFELLGFPPSGKKSGVPERIPPANRLIANRISSGWLIACEIPNRITEETEHQAKERRTMAIKITDICRYAVKGMSGEHLQSIALTAGLGLPDDRRFALSHGSTSFDINAPQWMPKSNFLMLAKNEKLAQLQTKFDSDSGQFTIERGGKQVVNAKITEPMGRMIVAQFFAGFLGEEARGAPKLIEAPGHMFSDVREKCISIINIASVQDLERVARRELDPVRFRGNLLIEGPAPWQEFKWVGQEIEISGVRLKVLSEIKRCPATSVNPTTAERDINVPQTLQKGFGHFNMGIYAEVLNDGTISVGDDLKI